MVVPVERASSSAKTKKYVGNDQIIELAENYSSIKVIGNRCTLNIAQNEGSVKVIGDSCEITVSCGRGSVHYVGNSGKIDFGEDADASRVTCIGNGVEITRRMRGKDGCSRTSVQEPVKSAKSGNRVNLRDKNYLHIGDCRNIFVALGHKHACIGVADLKARKKC